MGYTLHHAIVFTDDAETIGKAHAKEACAALAKFLRAVADGLETA